MGRATRTRVTVRRATMSAVLASAWMSAAALAQDEGAQPLEPILVVSASDLAAMLPSQKDAALRAALLMIPDRLRELKGAIPEAQQIPDDLLGLVDAVFENPWRLAVGTRGFNSKTGQPLIEGALSVHMEEGGKAAADAMHSRVGMILQMAGAAEGARNSEKFPGMQFMMSPAGMVAWGPREARDGWRYELLFGPVKDPDALFAALPQAPANLNVTGLGTLHLANLSPLIERFVTPLLSMSPQGKSMLEGLNAQGLLGEDALTIDWVGGYSGDAAVSTIIARNARPRAEAMGVATTHVEPADFHMIPADATWFSVGEMDIAAAWESMKAQMSQMPDGGQGVQQALDALREQTGVDFEQDVIAAWGGSGGAYFSDSTGGGSLTSLVMFGELQAAPRLRTAMAKLSGFANAAARENMPVPPGSMAVRLVTFERDGVEYTQLRFPGIPIPFEPTFATTTSYAILGLNPQATMAAVGQARNGGASSVLNTPAFQTATNGLGSGKLVNISYVNASRTIRDGFGALTFMGSALANAVRSVGDDSRDPGLVVPTMNALADGARGMVNVSYWSGDDFVYETRADASSLVNAAAILGVGDVAPLVIGAIIGGGVTAGIVEAQSQGLLPDPSMMGGPGMHQEEYGEDGEGEPAPRQPRRF